MGHTTVTNYLVPDAGSQPHTAFKPPSAVHIQWFVPLALTTRDPLHSPHARTSSDYAACYSNTFNLLRAYLPVVTTLPRPGPRKRCTPRILHADLTVDVTVHYGCLLLRLPFLWFLQDDGFLCILVPAGLYFIGRRQQPRLVTWSVCFVADTGCSRPAVDLPFYLSPRT